MTYGATYGTDYTSNYGHGVGDGPILVSIAVTVGAEGSPVARLADSTKQFTATGTYDDSSEADITGDVDWTSDTGATATINVATGLSTLVAVGTTLITATLGAIEGTATLRVVSIPTFVAVGSPDGQVGNIAPTLPAHLANDVFLLICETDASGAIAAPSGGWAEVENSPQTDFTPTGTTLGVFWLRAASDSEPGPSVLDAGNHCYGVVGSFRGCVESGDPWDVTAGGATAGTSSSIIIPGATTTVADCLIAATMSHGSDIDGPRVSGFANADLGSVTEQFDNCTIMGNGGGVAFATGTKAAAGAYGNTTGTLASAYYQAWLSVALKPVVTNC